MSSLTLSILILAAIVALAVGGQSLWVLLREKKKNAQLDEVRLSSKTDEALPSGMTGNSEVPGDVSEPHLALHPLDLTDRVEPSELSLDRESMAGSEVSSPFQGAGQGSEKTTSGSQASVSGQGDLLESLSPANQPAVNGTEPWRGPSAADALASTRNPARDVAPASQRVLDDEADCLVELPLLQASSGDKLLGLTKSIRRAGGKPVAFEGLLNGHWEGLRYGIAYTRLRAGILLANRQGPLNAMEFSEFTGKLQGLAAQLGVPLDMPDMNALLQRARSLDAMLADCDVQLGLAVDCARALSTADLSSLAKRLGLFERGNNRFASLSDAGDVIYSVALGDKTQRLQLMFDVPRVHASHNPWWQMAEAANQAATMFEGRITDDSGRELSEQSFRNVAIALEGRQQALQEAGIEPGSTLALRVFN
jgi:ZipA, C-terminal FtsZ-binding domain